MLEMLVLSRKKNESIMVGANIEITICEVRGNKVKLGISAPTSIPVHRKEVLETIHNKNVRRHKTQSSQRGKFIKRFLGRLGSPKALCVDSFCCPKQ